MRRIFCLLLMCFMLLCAGCEWQLKSNAEQAEEVQITIDRYDRIESLYLTTGDFAALQQMNTDYPMQTRMLIEDMLRIGQVNDPDINERFLNFFQDTTLQALIREVQWQYADVDDLNDELTAAFGRLKKELPTVDIPQIYAQIGSFDQSIIVGDNNTLGISLDKYLGADYQFYVENYSERQRRMMERSMIVPDCLGFYILSLYPMPRDWEQTQAGRDRHMGKIQWVVNKMMRRRVFQNKHVAEVERYVKQRRLTVAQLLNDTDSLAVR